MILLNTPLSKIEHLYTIRPQSSWYVNFYLHQLNWVMWGLKWVMWALNWVAWALNWVLWALNWVMWAINWDMWALNWVVWALNWVLRVLSQHKTLHKHICLGNIHRWGYESLSVVTGAQRMQHNTRLETSLLVEVRQDCDDI